MQTDFADPAKRDAIYALFGQIWPDLDRRIALAGELGWSWEEVSTPFAHFEGARALAHVGVVDVPMILDGVRHAVAGIHAVCTDPRARGRGLFRETMRAALEHVDRHWSIAKLSTGQPELYERFGFRVVEQHAFVLECTGSAGKGASPLGFDDLPWFRELLAQRTPLSHRCAAVDSGWLVGIDAVLWRGDLTLLHRIDDRVVAWELEDTTLRIHEVIGRDLGDLPSLLAAAPWDFDRVELWFTPDRFDVDARPIPWPDDDVLMVRGPFEVPSPFGMSLLASH